jgi:hypothetical protein
VSAPSSALWIPRCHGVAALNAVTRIREGSIEPGTRAIVAACVAAAAALLWLSGCDRFLARATLGPGQSYAGEGHNQVISDTNQQTLEQSFARLAASDCCPSRA